MTVEPLPPGSFVTVSAADSGYFSLLFDMVLSVRSLRAEVPIGVLDLGLLPGERAWLASRRVQLARPDWDVAFPGRLPETFKAQVARPILPISRPTICTYGWTRIPDCRTGDRSNCILAPAFHTARGYFFEPYAPHELIGVPHLAGKKQKNKVFRLDCLVDGDLNRSSVEISLCYNQSRALCGVRPAMAAV